MSNNVKQIANYVLTFYNNEKKHNILDSNDEALDIAIGMNNLRFQKIMYFAYGFYYSTTNQELFDAEFTAYKYGPIINELFQINNKVTKKNGYQNIPQKAYQKYSFENLNVDFKILDQVLLKLQDFSTWILVEMSHEPKSPWSRTPQSEIIKKDLIQAYFKNLKLV